MARKWKRPTRSELEQIRRECEERGIPKRQADGFIADAKRTAEESRRIDEAHANEVLESLPKRTDQELRAYHQEKIGREPPRKLPEEAAVYLPDFDHDYTKRIPCAPKPWFWIEEYHDHNRVWDGRTFVAGGYKRVDPSPWRHYDPDELAFLFPSAAECLDAAVRISDEISIDCVVHAFPR